MAETKSGIERSIDISQQVLRLLRDALFGLLVILLIGFPTLLSKRLTDAGFTKIGPEGVTWEAQVQAANKETKATAGTVTNLTQALTDAHQTLTQIEQQTNDSRINDPKLKASVTQLSQQITGALDQVQRADSSLKQTVLTQQTLLAQSATSPAAADVIPKSGWIFVGQVDQDQRSWVSGSPVNIVPVPYPLRVGQALTIAGENYLHADSETAQHREGKIVAVLRDGTQVHVLKTDLSHALAGGWFVWVQVSV
jgi:hypothetical protein